MPMMKWMFGWNSMLVSKNRFFLSIRSSLSGTSWQVKATWTSKTRKFWSREPALVSASQLLCSSPLLEWISIQSNLIRAWCHANRSQQQIGAAGRIIPVLPEQVTPGILPSRCHPSSVRTLSRTYGCRSRSFRTRFPLSQAQLQPEKYWILLVDRPLQNPAALSRPDALCKRHHHPRERRNRKVGIN